MSTTIKPVMAATAAFAVVVLAAACAPSETSDPRPTPAASAFVLSPEQRDKVSVVRVEPTEFARTVEVTGTVAFDSDHATTVISPISGPVTRLLVSLGAAVAAGQPLATVASPDFASAVSAYRKAEATAANARHVADLDRALFANDGIARRDLEQAETDAVAAEADRDAAQQALESLGVDRRTLAAIRAGRSTTAPLGTIRSPIAGTLVERLVTPGELLQAGATPCFTVADLSTVWVQASVFDADLPLVAAGDPAAVTVPGSHRELPGKVDYVSDIVDPTTRAVAVRVVVRNPGGALKKDQYVRARITSRLSSRGLLVPTSAVLRDDEDLPFVFVEEPGGEFARRRIVLGPRTDDELAVASGLEAGSRVVTEGGLFMQFAQSQ
jgi:membrane fusion protein, heavy metal efflux system